MFIAVLPYSSGPSSVTVLSLPFSRAWCDAGLVEHLSIEGLDSGRASLVGSSSEHRATPLSPMGVLPLCALV